MIELVGFFGKHFFLFFWKLKNEKKKCGGRNLMSRVLGKREVRGKKDRKERMYCYTRKISEKKPRKEKKKEVNFFLDFLFPEANKLFLIIQVEKKIPFQDRKKNTCAVTKNSPQMKET